MYKNSLFRSVDLVDSRILREGETPAPQGSFGFVLIDGEFVPYEFISKIKANLSKQPKQYESSIDADSFVNHAFWQSLADYERKLVAPCLLILLEQGYIYLREGVDSEAPPVVDAWKS
jgi:hypothetical protein